MTEPKHRRIPQLEVGIVVLLLSVIFFNWVLLSFILFLTNPLNRLQLKNLSGANTIQDKSYFRSVKTHLFFLVQENHYLALIYVKINVELTWHFVQSFFKLLPFKINSSFFFAGIVVKS